MNVLVFCSSISGFLKFLTRVEQGYADRLHTFTPVKKLLRNVHISFGHVIACEFLNRQSVAMMNADF